MKTSAMLTVIGLGLLAAEHGLAQMGGMGGGMGGGTAGATVVEEAMIMTVPAGWSPYGQSTEDKTDMYILPEGQSLSDWEEVLRYETFNSTEGIQSARQVYELRTESNRERCPAFASEILQDEMENGYSMIQWKQVCEMTEDETLASLHKIVLGNDQLYILSKLWKYDPPNRLWRSWENDFADIYVCDPTRPEHACGFEVQTAGAGGMGGGMGMGL